VNATLVKVSDSTEKMDKELLIAFPTSAIGFKTEYKNITIIRTTVATIIKMAI
jgi:hypothetical protein